MARKITKASITVDYVNHFVFDDVYEATNFMIMYTRGSNENVKFELEVVIEEVDDPVCSESVPATKGVDC